MDIYTATEEAYKNGYSKRDSELIRCRNCVYRWTPSESEDAVEKDDNCMLCFKIMKETRADFFCGFASRK